MIESESEKDIVRDILRESKLKEIIEQTDGIIKYYVEKLEHAVKETVRWSENKNCELESLRRVISEKDGYISEIMEIRERISKSSFSGILKK